MTRDEFKQAMNSIEGYYHRALEDNEVSALYDELQNLTYETYKSDIEFPLLKKIEYFTVAGLHRIIEEYNGLEEMKRHLGIKSWDELYEN